MPGEPRARRSVPFPAVRRLFPGGAAVLSAVNTACHEPQRGPGLVGAQLRLVDQRVRVVEQRGAVLRVGEIETSAAGAAGVVGERRLLGERHRLVALRIAALGARVVLRRCFEHLGVTVGHPLREQIGGDRDPGVTAYALLVGRSGDAGEREQAGGAACGSAAPRRTLADSVAETVNSAQEYFFLGRPRAFAAGGIIIGQAVASHVGGAPP
ncbi:hypothetical protein [Streptomyces sp. NPDC057909]|uniref:hypothetical protein n=1 Tax=Streptomyces sp. NPDC057909 TaxID=3346277 RepID=UPI0036E93E6A